MAKKNALGRGLGALIEENSSHDREVEKELVAPKATESINDINVDDIESNPYQPRTKFDEEALSELSASIKELGLIQPITVRSMGDGKYQLISGERRLKASKLAGLTKVPAFTRTADDQNMLEMALVENIQREDLDSIEVAISFQRLLDECKLTQEVLSERVGKKRSTVSNYLRLLKLPAEIQLAIRDKQISMGHARAIIAIDDSMLQLKIFNKILSDGLSVRKTEELVRKSNESEEKADAPTVYTETPEEIKAFERTLKGNFNQVNLNRGAKGDGKIVISFKSDDELQQIISTFDRLKS